VLPRPSRIMISTYMEPAEVNNAYFFGLQVNLRRSSLDIERWELRNGNQL
jgi:hypothetical protein